MSKAEARRMMQRFIVNTEPPGQRAESLLYLIAACLIDLVEEIEEAGPA